MLWLKALHLIFMVTWFAGLFYLPRLFVYHAMSTDPISIDRFKIMERKLYYGITTPGAILTILFGTLTLAQVGWGAYAVSHWLPVKLGLVLLLVIYQNPFIYIVLIISNLFIILPNSPQNFN